MDVDGQILDYRAGKCPLCIYPRSSSLSSNAGCPTCGGRFKIDQALQETFKTSKVVLMEYRLQVPEGERWFEAVWFH